EALFEDEPRFPSPADAAALYGNLLGLYDLLRAGERPDLGAKAPPKGPQKPVRPGARGPVEAELAAPEVTPPGLFPKEGPSAEWLDVAWGYLEGAPPRERTRLEHAVPTRQAHILQRA